MWNVECKMEPNIQKIVNGSLEEAGRLLSKSVEPEHLLLAIIRQEDEQVLQVLKLAGVDLLEIKFNLDKRVVGFTLETTELQLSDASNRVLRLMDLEARAMNSAPEAIHLLLAMLRDHNNGVFEVLSEFGVDYESVATTRTKTTSGETKRTMRSVGRNRLSFLRQSPSHEAPAAERSLTLRPWTALAPTSQQPQLRACWTL